MSCCSVAQKHSTPQLTPHDGWYVEATSDGGFAENVGDFASASEAADWKIDSLFQSAPEMKTLRSPGEFGQQFSPLSTGNFVYPCRQ